MIKNDNLVLTSNTKIIANEEERKFLKAQVLFEKFGYGVFVNDNNELQVSKAYNPDQKEVTWFISELNKDGFILSKLNGASMSFNREKQLDGSYIYSLGFMNLSKFDSNELQLVDLCLDLTYVTTDNLTKQ